MWTHGTIGDALTLIQNGVNCKQDKSGVGEKITRIETIADSSINYEKTGFAELDEKQKKKAKLEVDDILFSHINSPIHVGKTAIYDGTEPLFHGINLLRLRTIDAVDSSYFNMFLVSLFQSGYWQRTAKQSVNQASVNQTDIKSVPFSYPPLAEQQRIVAKLDAAFAEIDRAITGCSEQEKELERLYKTSLLSLFKDGIENEKWVLEPLQKHCGVVVGYVGEIASAYRELNNGVLLLSTTNIKSNDISLDKTKTVSFEFHEKNKKSQLKPGDILVARHGNSGEAAEIPSDIKEAQALNVIIIKKGETLESAYLVLLLNSRVLSQIGESKAGSVQQIINTKVIKDLMIPTPSLQRQVGIVKKLQNLSTKIEQMKRLLGEKLVGYKTLKSAILAQELQPPQSEAA